jgi:subtilisin family serine protease
VSVDRCLSAASLRFRPVLQLGVVFGVLALGFTAPPTIAGSTSPSVGVVDGSYIVTLAPEADPARDAPAMAVEYGGRAPFVYQRALPGFSFEGSAGSAARLARDPLVRTVVPDRRVQTTAQSVPTGISRIDGPLSGTVSGDGGGRVDADIAVIDTGIDTKHPDLNVAGGVNCSTGTGYEDDNGHGTHVAGTAAALDDGTGVVGVAPGARLWAVRVLDETGNGSWSSVICGVDWVTAHAADIEVANLSLAGSGDSGNCTDGGLRQAICRSVEAGVTYVVAAGNSRVDVATQVPASFPEVITVSALADFDGLPGGLGKATCRTDRDDTLAAFSNYGTGVDLIAPGVCINSTWKGGGYNVISGTSMAAPHVTGAAALYLSDHPGASPAVVAGALKAAGNLLWNATGDPDRAKETLLNVDSLIGSTVGSRRRAQ